MMIEKNLVLSIPFKGFVFAFGVDGEFEYYVENRCRNIIAKFDSREEAIKFLYEM